MSSKVNCPSHPDAALVEDHRAGDMICSGLVTHTTCIQVALCKKNPIDLPGGHISDTSSERKLFSLPPPPSNLICIGLGPLRFFKQTRRPSRAHNPGLFFQRFFHPTCQDAAKKLSLTKYSLGLVNQIYRF